MTEVLDPKGPQLSVLQIAWMQEIGIDKRMLARYAADSAVSPTALAETPMQGLAQSSAAPAEPAPDHRASSVAPGTNSASHTGTMQPSGLAPSGTGRHKPAVQAPAADVPMPHDWVALEAHIAACQVCGLQAGRSQTVFGTGVVQSPEWLLVGEAPGEYDDRVGLPFQGKPGVLLQAMLASIGVASTSAVFYTNLIKCRPLGNRTPKPEEIAACLPYLQRQIMLLKPRRILALGKLAAQALLGVDGDIEQLRGHVHHIRSESGQDIPLVVTYHPASLLLRPQHKADAWQDLNLARSITDN